MLILYFCLYFCLYLCLYLHLHSHTRAGKSSPASSSVCTNCNAGKYTPSAGMPSCSECPLFSVTLGGAGQSQCDFCGDGIKVSDGSTCGNSCPSGTYLSTALPYNRTLSYGSCVPCKAGSFALLGANVLTSTGCTLCPLGQYQENEQSVKCDLCDKGNPTPYEGADSKKLCTDPASNFITGFVVR